MKKKKKKMKPRIEVNEYAEIELPEGMEKKEVELEEVFKEKSERGKEKKESVESKRKEAGKKMKKRSKERKEAKKEAMKKIEEIPINRVETDIDKLMEIVENKESVNVQDVSKKLKIDVEQIEEWAKILEEHDLIEIVYPIVGLPVLRRKEWEKEKKKS